MAWPKVLMPEFRSSIHVASTDAATTTRNLVLDSPTPEEVSVKVLYLATSGSSDPTKASLPLHVAANGSVEAGQDCSVVLAGDATELVSRDIAERIEGVGVPPARELLQK